MHIVSAIYAITLTASTLGGPSYTDPFRITPEYKSDFINSEQCRDKSPRGKVFMGEKAVYVLEKTQVTVLLDEYARRFVLDYCQ